MKHIYKLWSGVVLTLLFLSSSLSAQEINIKDLIVRDGQIIIKYNLSDSDLNRRYSLFLYTSLDNYIQPVEFVMGDIGVDIQVGGNKQINWNAREELGPDFKGKFSVELKGSIYIPFIELDGFEDYEVLKRGKPYNITWTGGRGDNVLTFELYNNDKKVHVFDKRPNTGKTFLSIPTNVKPGKGYRLKISDASNKDEVVYSVNFIIKRKIPLVLSAGAGGIAGGAAAYLLQGLGTESNNEIPLPPKPSSSN